MSISKTFKDALNKNSLLYAVENQYVSDIARILKKNKPNTETDIVKKFGDNDSLPEIHKRYGDKKETILHVALDNLTGETSKILEMLLDAGADPTLTDINGNTPLHKAASLQCEDSLCGTYLFNAGLDAVDTLCQSEKNNINAQNNDGNTPLHMAHNRSYALMLMIFQFKADVMIKNNDELDFLENMMQNFQQEAIDFAEYCEGTDEYEEVYNAERERKEQEYEAIVSAIETGEDKEVLNLTPASDKPKVVRNFTVIK